MGPQFVPTLRDASAFFAKEGAVWETFERVARCLADEGIDYAAFDGIAMAIHGYMRFTSVVDILVTEQGLAAVQERLVGNGFIRSGAKKFLDETSGVEIRFTTGDLPAVATIVDGTCVIGIEKLIDWKLTDSLAGPHRYRPLGDVQCLIEALELPLDLAELLDPSVRDTYIEYWHGNQNATGPDRE